MNASQTESDVVTKKAGTYVPRDKRKLPQPEGANGAQRMAPVAAPMGAAAAAVPVPAGLPSAPVPVAAAPPVVVLPVVPAGPIGDGEGGETGMSMVSCFSRFLLCFF